MADLEEILNRVRKIPPLSQSALRLMELADEEDHSIEDVARIVETDAALTAEILRRANSTSLSLRHPIDTVDRAILFLTEKVVIGIALAKCAPHVYNRPMEGYESEQGELWTHSLRTAIAAREIAVLSEGLIRPNLAFTAGILHDIGKSVISEFLIGSAPGMLAKLDHHLLADYLQAEKELLGVNHCQVGAALAKKWSLPPALRAVILYHHKPRAAETADQPLTYAVHIGDIIAMLGGIGTGADALQYTIDEGYKKWIKLDRRKIDTLVLNCLLEFENIRAALFPGGKED